MSTHLLMVPIHLDALCLENDRSVIETMADFSRLPYCNGGCDINPDVANLSEEILSQPFQDRSLQLTAGVHLHWALPDALTRGFQQEGPSGQGGPNPIAFPPVPNRWLVTRTNGAQIRQWIVESDYLHPPGENGQEGRITYPYLNKSHPQPFRYLGRKMPLSEWRNQDARGESLETLTAVGYGEPTFAAFYPNCLSVFGFHDDSPPASLRGVQYDVLGWYGRPEQDCLQSKALLERFAGDKYNGLKEIYRWMVEGTQNKALPDFPIRTICYAHLVFADDAGADPLPEERKVAVALGNTATEALSAYLADLCARDATVAGVVESAAELEDQLEAIHLAGRLEGRGSDIGPKFIEARHHKEFTGIPAGTLWTIREESFASAPANAPEAAALTHDTLPLAVANQLHRLNACQQAYDREGHELDSMRKQLFADWYKYMLCVYPPEGNRDQYPDHDEVRDFIERNTLAPLQRKGAQNRARSFQRSQLVASLHRTVAELQLLRVEDISDWAKFQRQLQSSASSPVRRVVSLLTQATRDLLAAQTDLLGDEAKAQAIRDLNMMLRGGDLYEKTVFRDVAVAGECRSLVARLTEVPITRWPFHQLWRLNRLLLEAVFPDEIRKRACYVLKAISAPRYWQPNEPVALIVDEADKTVTASPRHGRDGRLRLDGLLECQVIEVENASIPDHFEQIRSSILALRPGPDKERIGFGTWTEQPWHPFLLEWEVELMPLKGKYKVSKTNRPLSRAYDPNCIGEDYHLPEGAVDLSVQKGQETLAKESNRYFGRSILTQHAKLQLIGQMRSFLENRLLAEYFTNQNVKEEEQTEDYFVRHLREIVDWYRAQGNQRDPVIDRMLSLYRHLSPEDAPDAAGVHFLAQSLGGFNEALLMQKQTFQLPIDEPLGFEGYREFTRAVREAVGNCNRVAPQPHNDFNPIRTGVLKIIQMRLVDTFGRSQRLLLQDNQVITTEVMATPGNPHLAILPPRIVQPSRLSFRWLAADDDFALEESDDPEMNAHPVSSPICGWLLPNNLDNSLIVYDAQGGALGSLGQGGRWEPARGSTPTEVAWPLPNPHLHKVLEYLRAQEQGTPGFLREFLTVVESALEGIDPESAGGHEALALLMGRPMAVVRAALNLELQGLPAVDQDWNLFRQDMERASENQGALAGASLGAMNREGEDFTKVEFPIRIGEYRQLNDGLVGYWIEEGDAYRSSKFHAPQALGDTAQGRVTSPRIAIHRENEPIVIWQSIDSPPQTLTMLIDPRGSVHATSGILPTKAIDIPAEQFAEALRNIEVTFLCAPILTDRGKISVPLPDEPGYQWSWLEKENGTWDAAKPLGPVATTATASGPQELREGWLRLKQRNQR